jgi:hypothetical protein
MRRVALSVCMKEKIALLRGQTAARSETPMRGFVQQLARYMLQVGIEAEATAFLSTRAWPNTRVRGGSRCTSCLATST